jgi:cysteine desulfurase
MAYFDHNATSPVSVGVQEAVVSGLGEFGNPSSVHAKGRAARKIIEDAREEIARLVGALPKNVIFTSGATEANNQALRSSGRKQVIASAIEHPSVLEISPDDPKIAITANGVVELESLSKILRRRGRFAVVSVMAANNESGVIQPIKGAAECAHAAGALFHCDAVQAVGRIPIDMKRLGVDMLTISAHKLGGPKGMGALILAEGMEIEALIRGGGQERRHRGGTENVPGIAGFGVAAREAQEKRLTIGRVANLIGILERHAVAAVPDAVIFGEDAPRIANTSLLALPGIDAETQIMALDLAGIEVSAGAACSSGKVSESHVLQAMGVADELGRCAIRISFGAENTLEEVDKFIEVWSGLRKRAG